MFYSIQINSVLGKSLAHPAPFPLLCIIYITCNVHFFIVHSHQSQPKCKHATKEHFHSSEKVPRISEVGVFYTYDPNELPLKTLFQGKERLAVVLGWLGCFI